MLTDLEKKKVVQHILNLAGIAESLSTAAENITQEIDNLAQVLGIECEFAPFDEDFPYPSITE
uniref:Uncharacterized protein n=1 Tax=Candidatus Kentrum sp. MB TaxID=2138164 RepID=A0A450WZQ7_9GAMM|nr:MAG: hypothetical protein BECKMB1821G_GA0114241_100258 [Candidatus Kentron sp. MB]VFK28882.1 MAG: hypothetical protein BECKMB1821I_GA0114274_100764 [Candidatus Kentron sp. MB]VFK74132.1 MAG: hypothetical protein BECKMB1821H_GA0114242_100163 [Candidatus Kentron sp. MB]